MDVGQCPADALGGRRWVEVPVVPQHFEEAEGWREGWSGVGLNGCDDSHIGL